jgi:peptidoglycan/xylan/chitin deacetylase (PgdA/CDA1 family)
MRANLKSWVENILVRSGAEHLSRHYRRGHTLVLAYHSIVPDEGRVTGDMSLHLAHRHFAQQLDILAETHDVVAMSGILNDNIPSSDRPRVVITFDDAYAGALSLGVSELVKREMPATIFVAPALLGSVPWWDRIADQTAGTIPESLRTYALDTLSGKTDFILRQMGGLRSNQKSVLKFQPIGTESELSKAAAQPGICLAAHSWSHPNLCRIDDDELAAELRRPLEWLRTRFASVLPWFSYPYGLHNERVQKAAANAGYTGAFRIDGGWMPRRAPFRPNSIPRFNVPSGLSLNGFRLRIAGR